MRWFVLFMLLCSVACAGEELLPFGSGSMKEITQAHGNQPLVISFWSVDCAPCYDELRLWREITGDYPQLHLVLVATDGSSSRQRVQQVLHESGLTHLPNYQFIDGNNQRLRYQVDSHWYGELPRTYLYTPGVEAPLAVSGVMERARLLAWLAAADIDM